jgi:hypothetical protein
VLADTNTELLDSRVVLQKNKDAQFKLCKELVSPRDEGMESPLVVRAMLRTTIVMYHVMKHSIHHTTPGSPNSPNNHHTLQQTNKQTKQTNKQTNKQTGDAVGAVDVDGGAREERVPHAQQLQERRLGHAPRRGACRQTDTPVPCSALRGCGWLAGWLVGWLS